eukprot:GHVU01020152.1.p1 GENE.GHVU01020152.1~~GHVU01020152.1.p1  ORF type:complete len:138 (-),score=0.81 GHVU01020152.1:145-558(-)
MIIHKHLSRYISLVGSILLFVRLECSSRMRQPTAKKQPSLLLPVYPVPTSHHDYQRRNSRAGSSLLPACPGDHESQSLLFCHEFPYPFPSASALSVPSFCDFVAMNRTRARLMSEQGERKNECIYGCSTVNRGDATL